jgi:hypothetical protein
LQHGIQQNPKGRQHRSWIGILSKFRLCQKVQHHKFPSSPAIWKASDADTNGMRQLDELVTVWRAGDDNIINMLKAKGIKVVRQLQDIN